VNIERRAHALTARRLHEGEQVGGFFRPLVHGGLDEGLGEVSAGAEEQMKQALDGSERSREARKKLRSDEDAGR
jgi:hypothetical protein